MELKLKLKVKTKVICYDPTAPKPTPFQDKNSAPRGSILNVWQGQFEHFKPYFF